MDVRASGAGGERFELVLKAGAAGAGGHFLGGIRFETLALGLGFHAGHQVVRAAGVSHAGLGFIDVFLDLRSLALGDDEILVAAVFGDFGFHRDDFLFELGHRRLLALPTWLQRCGAGFMLAGAFQRFHGQIFAAGAHGGFRLLLPLEFFGLLSF